MIEIVGTDGFKAVLDPDKVTAYGIDPPASRVLWVICDGKEYRVSVDVDDQLQRVKEAIDFGISCKTTPGFQNK